MSNHKKQQEIIEMIQAICEEMGWVVGIPSDEGSDEIVDGIIIGTEKFVYGIVESVHNHYEVFEKDVTDDSVKQIPEPKKKVTFH